MTTATTKTETKAADAAYKGAFATPEEAQAVKPAGDKLRLYRVAGPGGTVAYTWAESTGSAVIHVARSHGYQAGVLDKAPSKDKVAGLLAQLSADDRAALLAQYNGQPATAPAAGKDKKGGGK